MSKKVLVIHGGGPTAVINLSLLGVIEEALKYEDVKVFGAKFGMGGVLRREFLDLSNLTEEDRKKLRTTPGSLIGTSRDPLEDEDYEKIGNIIIEEDFDIVLLNGGNGTMNTTSKLYEKLKDKGVKVMGIPKTMDNDLLGTYHSPGFGSAGRYLLESVEEVVYDVRSLPIHVVVIEALGRNAGWVTASSALGVDKGYGPDLILLPEVPFDEEKFLNKIKELWEEKPGLVVVCSEGLRHENGEPITEPIFESGRATYFGDVSSHLANLIVKELGIKARSEKPGLLGRVAIEKRSEMDMEDAYQVGAYALKLALDGISGKMIGIEKTEKGRDYVLVDIDEKMLEEKTIPLDWIDIDNYFVKEELLDYLRPIVGKSSTNFLEIR